ncbi:protein kinase domain containing protein [Acanthamoeba castellanii str. Neff]|uniref:non-specific serine/threonine protein kinase n=1 Tax=Acanthamoeba castellanii (strain ATCC 30010 / Neff) TaxID=1257118 RepID=L8HHB6_ACACF|nr:protein kinase domain containing protein [Acanthamoeba castellanii str. Neff]ELR24565.1 protein kinase domain containing protein [Acanthamoeba castellanii str. Neff]
MSKKTKVVDPYSLNEEDRRKFYEKEQQRARETEEKRKKEEEKAKKKEWEKQSAKRKKEEEKAKKKEAKGTKKDKKGGKDEPMVGRVIGTPTNFKREMHIGFNPDTGMFEGIPQEWKVMLGQAGLSAQEIAEDADMLVSVFKVMQFEQNKPERPANLAGSAIQQRMATLRRGITPAAFPPVPPPPQAGSASPRNSPASVPRLPVASSPRGLTNAAQALPPPSGLLSPRPHSLNQRLTGDGATRPTSLSQRVPPVVGSPDDRALPPLPPAPLLEGDDYDDRGLPPPPLPRTADAPVTTADRGLPPPPGAGGPAGFTPPLRPAPSPRGVVPPSPGRAMPGPGGPSSLRAVGATPPSPLSPRPSHAFQQAPADRDLPPPPPRDEPQVPVGRPASVLIPPITPPSSTPLGRPTPSPGGRPLPPATPAAPGSPMSSRPQPPIATGSPGGRPVPPSPSGRPAPPSPSGRPAPPGQGAPPPAGGSDESPTAGVEIDDLVLKGVDPTTLFTDMAIVGQGASGAVYSATDKRTGRKVAIKQMVVAKQVKKEIIINEIMIMKQSTHAAIVNFVDAFLVDGILWVVMELVDGGSLSELLTLGIRLTEPQIAAITKSTLEAIEYLHNRPKPIIHRDIKSENVLLGLGGEIKITDFGYGSQLSSAQDTRKSVVGTTFWMAPELVKGQHYTCKVDALFLIAKKGRPPFKDPDAMSAQFKDFIEKCTIMDPSLRPDSTQMLSHPFLKLACDPRELLSLVQRTKNESVREYIPDE